FLSMGLGSDIRNGSNLLISYRDVNDMMRKVPEMSDWHSDFTSPNEITRKNKFYSLKYDQELQPLIMDLTYYIGLLQGGSESLGMRTLPIMKGGIHLPWNSAS